MDEYRQLMEQWKRLVVFAEKHADENGVSIVYYDAFGKFPCLQVSCDKYTFEMNYNPKDVIKKNEIRTNIYYNFLDKNGREQSKCFMIKKGASPSELTIFTRIRSDYHYLPVTHSNWADKMINTVKWIRNNNEAFIKLCRVSRPYNDDGSHKFNSWKNYATVEIVHMSDNPLVQGIKGGKNPVGSHFVGGNGSFRVFNKGVYGLQYTVERVAGEKPRRGYPIFVEMDEYLRQLRDSLGYVRKMPKELLNSRLPDRVEVITYDMNSPPEDRNFVPVEYEGDWMRFVQECFKDLLPSFGR